MEYKTSCEIVSATTTAVRVRSNGSYIRFGLRTGSRVDSRVTRVMGGRELEGDFRVKSILKMYVHKLTIKKYVQENLQTKICAENHQNMP